jgi:DNA repair protein RecO (recombination protein O)
MNNLTQAWVLHRRDYRNTSLLVDAFCHTHGYIRLIAKGAKRKHWQHWLQPFIALQLGHVGRGELWILTQVEPGDLSLTLAADRYYCGFYLNELLLRALPWQEAHPDIFELYQCTLQQLATQAAIEPCLRRFEWQLLTALGYGIDFVDAHTQQTLVAERDYVFQVGEGFVAVDTNNLPAAHTFRGRELLTLAQGGLTEALPAAKRLMRVALISIIGDKPLMSRQLFVKS